MKGFKTLTMQDLEYDPDRGGYRIKHDHARNSSALSAANPQSGAGDEPVGTQTPSGLDRRCHLTVHSKRHRLTDPGGARCYKYVVDALVAAHILVDDSAKYIKEPVLSTQEKIPTSEPEETILMLTWDSENPDIVGCSSPDVKFPPERYV